MFRDMSLILVAGELSEVRREILLDRALKIGSRDRRRDRRIDRRVVRGRDKGLRGMDHLRGLRVSACYIQLQHRSHLVSSKLLHE